MFPMHMLSSFQNRRLSTIKLIKLIAFWFWSYFAYFTALYVFNPSAIMFHVTGFAMNIRLNSVNYTSLLGR